MRIGVVFVTTAFALTMRILPAEAAVIDDFSEGPLVIVGADATVQQTQTGLDPGHVLGGSREISFRSFSTPPSTLTINNLAGTLSVGPGNCCTYLTLNYGSPANPLQLDMRADRSDRFVVAFAGIRGEIRFSLPSIVAIDHQNHIASIVNTSSLAQPTGPFSITVPFSQFPNFDFSNVRLIQIGVSRYGGGTGAAGSSFTLDSIITVPEHMATWFDCFVCVALGQIRFRGAVFCGPVQPRTVAGRERVC